MRQLDFQVDKLPRWLRTTTEKSNRILWVGALSFEKRSIGTLAKLVEGGLVVTDAMLINYSTKAYPEEEDRKRREDNWVAFKNITAGIGISAPNPVSVEPYAFESIQVAVEDLIRSSSPDFIIFDITCLTKIHTMALAALLSCREDRPEWSVAYCSPENYGNLTSQDPGFGWKDVIIAPLDDTALLYNEGRSRGIIIIGHESDRLVVALSEVEPSGGVFLSAQTHNRPDLCLLAERKNNRAIRQLRQMRLSDWTQVSVSTHMPSMTIQYVDREIEIAKECHAPVLLFPFGPKPLIFATVRQLCTHYPQASWFIYPLPSAYDVDYTEGIGGVSWFRQDEFSSVQKDHTDKTKSADFFI